TLERRIYDEIARLNRHRKQLKAHYNGGMEVISTQNPHLLGYVRQKNGQRLLVINNFSEHPQTMGENRLRLYGLGYRFIDHITGKERSAREPLQVDPYQFLWLENQAS
ncbi:MAG: alpha-glucosidase C-terminal domain-containing protein, partial [Desulfococcus multivorans]|nr:alpha-glucosidase C-terminal domain-containing protein [Desulfococcus multivorans]